MNSNKSSTLDSTTTSSNTELSERAIHQNKMKFGTRQKPSTMQNMQSNDSTSATYEIPEWIHVTSNTSSFGPPPVVKQERHSRTPEWDTQRIACNTTRTRPYYSGSPRQEVAHASMSWTDCHNDECQIHLSKNQG